MSVLALLVPGLSGCQREANPLEEQQNGENGVQEVVTSFVFNVSTSAARTKQTADDTQAAGDHFRGIVDSKLMAIYSLGDTYDGSILVDDRDADKVYDLSKFAEENKISSSQSRRVLQMSLPLKTNMLVFYGRAGIPAYTTTNGITKDDKYGALENYSVSSLANQSDFELKKRLQDADRYYVAEELLAGILTVIMNTGLADKDDDGMADDAISSGEDEGTANAYGFDLAANSYPAVNWADYAAGDTSPVEAGSPAEGDPEDDDYVPAVPAHDLYPLEAQLKYTYQQMTTIRSDDGELRAAAGEDIIRVITDLWSNINAIRCAAPISGAEAVAKHLAAKIHDHIFVYFAATVPTDGSALESKASFKGLTSTVIPNFKIDAFWPKDNNSATKKASEYKPSDADLAKLKVGDISDFPFSFNMPRGVSYMAFDSESLCFYYPQQFNTSAVSGDPTDPTQTDNPTTSVPYDANSYFFPAEILYFGNSPVRVSDLEHKTSSYPGTTETGVWSDVSKWPEKVATSAKPIDPEDDSTWQWDWHGSHVVSSTRSVAMKYDINYGVAMLETKVGYKVTSLKDNNHAVQAMNAGYASVEAYDAAGHSQDEPDKTIPITPDSFKLTGVIVGGQPVHVGWNFLPKKASSTSEIIETGFIYDKNIANKDIPTPDDAANYTVVFDNFNANALANSRPQDKVFVALEFQNNTGTDFYGNCNLIREDGYFYLIAALDPADDKATAISWPKQTATNEISHIVPPYAEDTYDVGEGDDKVTMHGAHSKEITRVFVQDFVTKATFKFGENSLKYAYLTVPDLRASSVTIGLSVDIQWESGLAYEDVILGGE